MNDEDEPKIKFYQILTPNGKLPPELEEILRHFSMVADGQDFPVPNYQNNLIKIDFQKKEKINE